MYERTGNWFSSNRRPEGYWKFSRDVLVLYITRCSSSSLSPPLPSLFLSLSSYLLASPISSLPFLHSPCLSYPISYPSIITLLPLPLPSFSRPPSVVLSFILLNTYLFLPCSSTVLYNAITSVIGIKLPTLKSLV